jgi:hypothetical protein
MEYLLLLYGDARWMNLPAEERARIVREYDALTDEMGDACVYVSGGPLRATSHGSTVRVRGDRLLVADNPFAETNAQLGGYFLIDVASPGEARAWAARIPGAQWGAVEVRPLLEVEARASAA